MTFDAHFGLALLELTWINILLSGDNAVVIALACRSLPPRQQKWGIVLGTVPAIILRIIFALSIVYLMAIPYLKLVGAALLLWIAVKMLQPEDSESQDEGKAATTVWAAARMIVVADAVMSLDNVIAIAAAAHGDVPLLVIGLAISMPLIIFGSALLLKILTRFPVLVLAGGALLGWIAGDVAISDPAVAGWVEEHAPYLEHGVASIIGAVVVLAAGPLMARLSQRRGAIDLLI
jgi:YjbE family integral membrane protein